MPEPGSYVGLDWIRCTAPDSSLRTIDSLLTARFGDEPRQFCRARHYDSGWMMEPGVVVSWGHKHRVCQVDVQGRCLRLMDGGARVELLHDIMSVGFKPTRIDGAVDWVGRRVRLCDHAIRSCERGELCILRTYGPHDKFTALGIPKRRHVELGGRESSAFVRIYDKGLEQRVAPAGHWERLETEWKEDRAQQVGQLLCQWPRPDPSVLRSLTLGAMDFRKVTGRTELERRPRVRWWERILSGAEPMRTPAAMEDPTLASWGHWSRTAWIPRVLELAGAAGVTPHEVFDWLAAGVVPGQRGGRLVKQFTEAFGDRRAGGERQSPAAQAPSPVGMSDLFIGAFR